MDLPPAVAAAWGRASVGTRGPKPGLSIGVIAQAAIDIADKEGLSGVSMSRVAQALGVTSMSLYRYVGSKQELLTHMSDRAIGAPPSDATVATDWRSGLEGWTKALLARYFAHSWNAEIPVEGPPLMPHNLEWMDQALGIMAGLPLSPLEKISSISLLSVYARAEALNAVAIERARTAEGRSAVGEDDAYERALDDLTGPSLPHLRALVDQGLFTPPPGPPPSPGAGDTFMFDFGLDRILDGLAGLVTNRPT